MPAVLAHAVGGSQFPIPLWLLGYGTGFLLVLVALALRTLAVRPVLARGTSRTPTDPSSEQPLALRVVVLVVRALLVVAWAVTVTAAFIGADDSGSNVTTYAVYTGWFLGGFLLAALAGDAWRFINPLDSIAVLVLGRRVPERTERPAPSWTAPAMLASFAVVATAWHLRLSPRAVGGWLVAYTVAALAGAAAWGRAWLREGEGFAALFSVVGSVSPFGRRARAAAAVAEPGATALVSVAIGTILFDSVRQYDWWVRDVVGVRADWPRTLVHVAGLGFTTAAVATIWTAATATADRADVDTDAEQSPPWLAVLVPLLVGFVVARYAARFVEDGWNLVALASDPYGRGWDLFGTIGWFPDPTIRTSALVAWVEVLAVVVGGVAAVVVAHDVALRRYRSPRRAATASLPVIGAVVVLTIAALGLLLGG